MRASPALADMTSALKCSSGLATGRLSRERPGGARSSALYWLRLVATSMCEDMGVSTAVLEVAGLQRWFGDFDVFGSLTFDIAEGRLLALVGPNGSGKSTVLRCVCGIDTPTSGTVRIAGENVDERVPSIRSKLASVIDDLDFFPDLSVIEHLELLARAHGVDHPKRKADRVLDDVGLIQQASQLPGTLSTGQRHRLALATAFVRPRSLLVLDEPEQHLDEPGLLWLTERLNLERGNGLAVLLASHDASLVNSVADDVMTLSEPE